MGAFSEPCSGAVGGESAAAAHLPDPVLDQGEQAGVEWLQLRGITKDGVLVVLGDLAVAGAAELPLPVPEPSLLDVLLALLLPPLAETVMVNHPVVLTCAALKHDGTLLNGPVHDLLDVAPLVREGAGQESCPVTGEVGFLMNKLVRIEILQVSALLLGSLCHVQLRRCHLHTLGPLEWLLLLIY